MMQFVSLFACADEYVIMPSGVLTLLSKFDPEKAPDPDGIAQIVLKETKFEICISLHSCLTSLLPTASYLMIGVMQIYLLCTRKNLAIFLPTTVQCPQHRFAAKSLKHIIYSSVAQFLSQHELISSRQHGFQKFFSCESQLISAIDDWVKHLDKGIRTDVIILDFIKSFNSVTHLHLLPKLEVLGIRGNFRNWMSSFLIGS